MTTGCLAVLRQRADELGVGARVHHLGHVTAETLASLYRRAQAMVFPSLHEGFGAPPLDAALLFDPRSVESISGAVARIGADTDLRERLRAAGLARARSFTWHGSAERHRAIYARVAATREP